MKRKATSITFTDVYLWDNDPNNYKKKNLSNNVEDFDDWTFRNFLYYFSFFFRSFPKLKTIKFLKGANIDLEIYMIPLRVVFRSRKINVKWSDSETQDECSSWRIGYL